MIHQKYVDEYIQDYKSGKILLNKERIALIEFVEQKIYTREDIYFHDEMIEQCVQYIEKWYFPLLPFQKFIISFVFLFFSANNRNVFKKFLIMMGRGGGKNGLISGVSNFLQTPFHNINDYNISIVANSEEQAKTSFDEIYLTIERNPQLKQFFKNTKTQIVGKQTNAIIQYRTSNGNTKDGLRDGAVVFDEIHQYESNKDVKVHISGLGKRPNPREFYIGTDGYVREGFIDSLKEKASKVLNGKTRFNALFPFICKLDDEQEVNDPKNWEKANPMFSLPMCAYAENLFDEVLEQFEDLQDDPSNREEFMTKRMNLPVSDTERSVATYEELLATKREVGDVEGFQCIGGLDFASIRDFAAVGLLFKQEEEYFWLTHSFVRKEFVDNFYGYSRPRESVNGKRQFAPIKEWEEKGFLTVLDEPSINPQHIVDWFLEKAYHHSIKKIVADNFRMDILRPLFENAGLEVLVLKNPRAIDSLLAPRIESAFANHRVRFGDNQMMRWYTNNVLRKLKKDGNVEYLKKEEVRRKTDGFKAFEYAMYLGDELDSGNIDDYLDIANSFF
ncbi:Phage terminase-like protein, large subunit, contains N-terminal HTH domain [Pilibacter termitis]|uniref:Phage terminase-like protein, large subunit, contains N-terminal HTH domain n=1 Tax=Pilibacter termitis TaxID=263852 RepID=A0A1T4PDF7_9ENTE|nr:terminase TerL endonuclease subunit [Pilibacter termitis]SJZ89615.1 Phage terminase-like protein, large subunit, contains N-terminal HTH domain [Pilibacter termitis]